jgi:hypothetical protein
MHIQQQQEDIDQLRNGSPIPSSMGKGAYYSSGTPDNDFYSTAFLFILWTGSSIQIWTTFTAQPLSSITKGCVLVFHSHQELVIPISGQVLLCC